MNLSRLLSGRELRSLLWRSAGIAIASASSLMAVKAFLAADPQGAPGMVAMVGWLAFVPLAMLGFGRPLYSAVRAQLVRGQAAGASVRAFSRLGGVLAALAVLVFAAFGPWVALRQGHAGPVLGLAVFAAGLVAANSGTFVRDLAYAVSEEDAFERGEFVRKLLQLLAYGGVFQGVPLVVVGGLLLLASAASHVPLLRHLRRQHGGAQAEGGSFWAPLRPLAAPSWRYLVFSANEVLLYNLPLVYFSWVGGAPQLLYFGVWMRLFQLVVLPMRVLADARVNRQTGAYFQGETAVVRRELRTSLRAAVAVVGVTLVGAWLLREQVLGWLGAGVLVDDRWFLPALAVWGLGNALQHVLGSFVLSYGGGFGFALRSSLVTVLSMALAFGVARAVGADVGQLLFVCGLVYCGFTLAYGRHVRTCLSLDTVRT